MVGEMATLQAADHLRDLAQIVTAHKKKFMRSKMSYKPFDCDEHNLEAQPYAARNRKGSAVKR